MKPKAIAHIGSQSYAVGIYQTLLDSVEYIAGAPHLFIRAVMDAYRDYASKHPLNRRAYAKVFEFAIGEALMCEGIQPLYYQAMLRHAPLAKFDWCLYHPETPVLLSCATKTPHQWRQAAMEARSVKRVYGRAINYLVVPELLSQSRDMGPARAGIDCVVVATHEAFDRAMLDIKATSYCEAKPVSPIITGKLVQPKGDSE